LSLFLAILESVCCLKVYIYTFSSLTYPRFKYAISTTLPVIVQELHSDGFLWVASSYGITSTVLLPLSGELAEVCPSLAHICVENRIKDADNPQILK
jgi:hypothetical protein